MRLYGSWVKKPGEPDDFQTVLLGVARGAISVADGLATFDWLPTWDENQNLVFRHTSEDYERVRGTYHYAAGDGTLTILVLATGSDRWLDSDGKLLFANPGQIRFEILIDHNGTPSDPSDDVFLEDLRTQVGQALSGELRGQAPRHLQDVDVHAAGVADTWLVEGRGVHAEHGYSAGCAGATPVRHRWRPFPSIDSPLHTYTTCRMPVFFQHAVCLIDRSVANS
jgi:hypothetical protein